MSAERFTVRAADPADLEQVAAGRLTGVGRQHGRWIDTVVMQREPGPAE